MRRLLLIAVIGLGCGGDDPAATDAPPNGDAPVGCSDAAPWAAVPPLAIGATQETAVVGLAGKIYILGGFNDGGITTAVQVFDTATCTYSAGPPMPKAVHHINAAVVGDSIIVGGSLEALSFTAIGDTWSWNPATDADWTIRAPMPAGTQRGAGVAGEVDGKLMVAGGFRANSAVNEVSLYDPSTDMWSAESALPTPRDHACGGVIGGKLYVAGGRMAQITSNVASMFEFSPGPGWSTKTAMPTARGGTACGVVGDRLIVVGGEGNRDIASGVFAQVEAYTPATDSWETLTPMPTPRHGMGAAALDGRVYVPGGADTQGFGAVATHEILTP